MSLKQEESYFSSDAGLETIDDNPSQRGEICRTSAVVEGLPNSVVENQLVFPIHTNVQKRSRPPIETEESSSNCKKIRSDSYTNTFKEDIQSHVNSNTVYPGEFDLCTPEGQIAASKAEHPETKTHMTWEQAKHAARREYNRVNAARARQRHKEDAETRDQQIAKLKSQVEQLTRLNEVLMNYICEMQASSNKPSVAQMGTPFNHALLDAAASIESKTSATNTIQPNSTSALHSATNSALMSLLKEKQMAENVQAQQQNHQTFMNSNMSMLNNEKSYIAHDTSPNLAASTDPSIGPLVRALQAQQLLAEAAKSNNAQFPWNTGPVVPPPCPSQATNSLWDVLLSIQQLHNLLPSSGAPK